MRLFSVPLIVFLIWRTPEADASRYTACWLVAFLHAGDMLDGYLARMGKQTLAAPNHFGEMVDPLADKMYLGAAYITLALTDQFAGWFGALVIVRDLAIVLGWTMVFKRFGLRLRPNMIGKATDAGLAILLAAILLRLEPNILALMTLAATTLILWSGWAYWRMALQSVSSGTMRRLGSAAARPGSGRVQRGGIRSAS